MKFCAECDKDLPDDSNFCLRCGYAQSPHAASWPREEGRWEIARIRSRVLKKDRFSRICTCAFVLEAVGTGGASIAESSPTFQYYFGYDPLAHGSPFVPVNENRTTRDAFESFVAKIVAGGWQPLPYQESWYQWHFRRRIGHQKPGRLGSAHPDSRAARVPD